MFEKFVFGAYAGQREHAPTISIRGGPPTARLAISKSGMALMGNPRYVALLIDEEAQLFGLALKPDEWEGSYRTISLRRDGAGTLGIGGIMRIDWLPAGVYLLRPQSVPHADRANVGVESVCMFGPSTLRRLHRPKPFRVVRQASDAHAA